MSWPNHSSHVVKWSLRAKILLTGLVRIGRTAADWLYPMMPSRQTTNWCHSIWPVVPPGWLRWQYQRQWTSVAASRGNVWHSASRHRLTTTPQTHIHCMLKIYELVAVIFITLSTTSWHRTRKPNNWVGVNVPSQHIGHFKHASFQ